jgi:hypothetical protein
MALILANLIESVGRFYNNIIRGSNEHNSTTAPAEMIA